MPAQGRYHCPGLMTKYSPTNVAPSGTETMVPVLLESPIPMVPADDVKARSWKVSAPALVGLAVEVVVRTGLLLGCLM